MNRIIVPGISICDLVAVAREASQKILLIKKHAQLNITQKQDSSPLTDADTAASEHILSRLKALDPSIPAISEEKISTIPRSSSQYWLIDPLDGTREFVKGTSEYTVNIALVKSMNSEFGVDRKRVV